MSKRRVRGLGLAAAGASLALALLGPSLLVGVGALSNALQGQPGAPVVCAYRARTGRPCPGCGGTRALQLALQGRLGAAIARNPLGAWVGLCLWLGVLGGACATALGRLPAWRQMAVALLTAGGLAGVVTLTWWWRGTGPG